MCRWKNFENWQAFGEDVDKSIKSAFLCLHKARLAGRGIVFSTCPLMPPRGQTGRQRHCLLNLPIDSFLHPSVHLSVTKLVNTIFWKRMNRFRCQLAQVVLGARAWDINFGGLEVNVTRGHRIQGSMHEAEGVTSHVSFSLIYRPARGYLMIPIPTHSHIAQLVPTPQIFQIFSPTPPRPCSHCPRPHPNSMLTHVPNHLLTHLALL